MPASRTHLGEGDHLYLVFGEPPLEVDEHGVVEAELGEAVRAEGEEDLLGPHHAAVSHLGYSMISVSCNTAAQHLVCVGMPGGGALLLVILHVDAAELSCNDIKSCH